MSAKALETQIIVCEVFSQIGAESKKSVWERNTALLGKLHSYLIDQINELACYGIVARFGADTPDHIADEIAARNAERLRKIENRKRAMNKEDAKVRATRIMERVKVSSEGY